MNAADLIKVKEKLIEDTSIEISKLKTLLSKYPSLRESQDRWNNKRLSAEEVNSIADQVGFSNSCGCCSDSPWLAWLYLEDEGIKVHTSPPNIIVGERNAYGSGERPYSDWKETASKHGASETIIQTIQKYLDENPPEDYDDEVEDDEDSGDPNDEEW